jgi:vancomycin resistance protein VanW
MLFDGQKYSKTLSKTMLPVRVYKHKSLVLRKLGDVDMVLQYNKVVNLKLAAAKLDGAFIKPKETFSLWRFVGSTTESKGYLPGLCLMNGAAISNTGGGLCQLANLLYWMILHTGLETIERHHHQYDPFPDFGRVIPFGTGAGIMYNFKDLRFKNNTDFTYQIHVWFDEEYIHGCIFSDTEPQVNYHIYEQDHHFVRRENGIYRQNKIYRHTINKSTGDLMGCEMLFRNDSLVKYQVDEDKIVSESLTL